MFGLLFAFATSRHYESGHRHTHRMKFYAVNSQTGTVTADVLNVRSGPSTSYSVVGQLRCGAQVTIISTSGVWYKIQTSSLSGYCHSDYISVGSSSSGKRMTGFYTTGYYPDDSPMEGGYFDCLGNKLRTLQQYMNYNAAYVSIAVDKTVIPMKSIVNIDGYTRGGSPVKFWACDVGGAIKNKHIDICCANAAETYKVTKNGVGITVYGTSSQPQ